MAHPVRPLELLADRFGRAQLAVLPPLGRPDAAFRAAEVAFRRYGQPVGSLVEGIEGEQPAAVSLVQVEGGSHCNGEAVGPGDPRERGQWLAEVEAGLLLPRAIPEDQHTILRGG